MKATPGFFSLKGVNFSPLVIFSTEEKNPPLAAAVPIVSKYLERIHILFQIKEGLIIAFGLVIAHHLKEEMSQSVKDEEEDNDL